VGVPGYSAWSRADDLRGASQSPQLAAEVLPGTPTGPSPYGLYLLRFFGYVRKTWSQSGEETP
jgi:hypothetical protein